MTKRPYDKPALTYTQQVERLQERGIQISDPAYAEFCLQHYNYYRLGAYWLLFEEDHPSHRFKAGTRFEDVINLYTFDRELRLLVMNAIERVEVSVRAQWAYQMAHCHGPHSELASGIAVNKFHWERNIADLKEEVHRSEEIFIQHFAETYQEALPPTWAVCEVMSLGLLSRWYKNLRPKRTRQLIANPYGVDEIVLQSWLHHLSIVRNICAHHSRLWDRSFSLLPAAPKSKPAYLAYEFVNNRKLYNSLVILLHMIDVISPKSEWRKHLKNLLLKHKVPTTIMGFPENWESRVIWKEKSPK